MQRGGRGWRVHLARWWTPVDDHPRTAFTSMAAVALALALLVGAVSWNVSAGVARQKELEEREAATFHEAPSQFGANVDPEGTRHGGPLRMSFIGASVTRGWFVTSIERTYPAVASRMIATSRQRDVDYHVVALPGAPVDVALRWSIPSDQDIVVIHLISDDFLYGTPLADYQKEYRQFLAKVRKASPKAGIVCLGDWGEPDAVNKEGASSFLYEAIVTRACKRYGGVYVPLSQDYEIPEARGPKGHPSIFGPALADFHPNDYGDQLIAESVVEGIDGDPPEEAIVVGSTSAPEQIGPRPTPGATPETRDGHEAHAATPLPKIRVTPAG
jgi:GDSL-like Lipase/Acylhydrolase family